MKTAQEFFKEEFEKTQCYIDYDNPGLECIKKAMKDYAIYIANYAYNQGVTEAVTNTINKSAYSQKLHKEL